MIEALVGRAAYEVVGRYGLRARRTPRSVAAIEVLLAEELAVARKTLVTQARLAVGALYARLVPHALRHVVHVLVEDGLRATGTLCQRVAHVCRLHVHLHLLLLLLLMVMMMMVVLMKEMLLMMSVMIHRRLLLLLWLLMVMHWH